MQQLEYLFESVLPVPVEQVHAVFHRLNDGRYLACAIDKDLLAQLVASDENGVTVLTPSGLPAFIDADVNPHQLNLLVRQFEPGPVKRLRRIMLVHAAMLLLACALVIATGLELRGKQFRQQAQVARQREADLYAQVLGPEAADSRQPFELQLRAQLRQLRQTRSASTPQTESIDVSDTIAALLARWPNANEQAGENPLYMRTELISVTPSAITVRGLLPGSSDAQRLADDLRDLDNWQLREPQIVTTGDSVQATLQFIPEVKQ